LHCIFPNGAEFDKVVEEQRLVIQTKKLNPALQFDKVVHAIEDSIWKLDNTFKDDGYVVANT
jgi:hypothetical protein